MTTQTKLCEHCKSAIPHDARTCAHCGKDVGAGPVIAAVIQLIVTGAGLYFLWQWWSSYSAAISKLAK